MTDEQVIEARQAYAAGNRKTVNCAALAERYGVSREYMRLLVRGSYRRRVGGPTVEELHDKRTRAKKEEG